LQARFSSPDALEAAARRGAPTAPLKEPQAHPGSPPVFGRPAPAPSVALPERPPPGLACVRARVPPHGRRNLVLP